jgi:hypothetical protein
MVNLTEHEGIMVPEDMRLAMVEGKVSEEEWSDFSIRLVRRALRRCGITEIKKGNGWRQNEQGTLILGNTEGL